MGDTSIPEGEILIVDPGVVIFYEGVYCFIIGGVIRLNRTENGSIT